MIMQLETCFITGSSVAQGVASVCADVQPPWTGTWCLFIVVQKPFANREMFVFLPSPEALVPQKHKWILFISLYLSLQTNTWLSRGAKHFQPPLRQSLTRPLPHTVIYSRIAPLLGAGSGGFAFRGGDGALQAKGGKRGLPTLAFTCISPGQANAPLPAEL